MSAAQTLTLTNSTGSDLSALTMTASGPFAIAQSDCTGNLAAGAGCSVAIAFQPVVSGAVIGTLAVSSSGLATPLSIALSGTGFDFTAAVSGASSLTIASGQSASYTVTISPAGGVQGTFNYACGTLPANAVCVFNPTSTTVSGGVTGSVTVQIATGKTSTARMESPAAWGALPMLCALVLLPVALRRARRRLLLVLLVALLAGGVGGCTSSGGGASNSGSSGSSSSTPAGTYSIPVTVTSTGVSHAVTLTLTVV